jgi:starch-binding outer membrane protein, SusD/RagB family
MKKFIIYFISLIALSGTVQSCSDYLQEENPNSVSAEIYWSTLDETNATLTTVYAASLNHFIWNFDVDAWRSDLAYPKSRIIPYVPAANYYQQTYNSNSIEVINRWNAIYQVIWRANQTIFGLNGLDAELKAQDAWKTQMAQARFFRGLMHFYLHSVYNNGNIIIRDFLPVSTQDFSKSVSTSDEVVAFFREDLKYAYENLPAQYTASNDRARVTAGSAATILGRSYLYTEEYDTALIYLNDVINNGAYGYNLLTGNNVNLLFTSAGDFNSESIFELNYSSIQQIEESQWDEESFNNRWARYFGAPGSLAGGGNSYIVPSAWLTLAYMDEPMDSQDQRNYVDNGSGGKVLKNVSLRCSQMIAVVNDEATTFYKSTPANVAFAFGGTSFSFFKQYSNHDIVALENDILQTSWKSGKNVVVDRLADVYLMQAECLIKTADLTNAIKSINTIRERWGLVLLGASDGSAHDFDGEDYISDGGTKLMEHLMYVERPLELSVEGYATRSIDLRRWQVAKQRFEYLKTLDFNLVNYTTGTTSRAKSLLKAGPSADLSDKTISIKEYEDAALNYSSAKNDYFPLPTSETLNNQNVGK